MHVSVGAHEIQKRVLDSLELEYAVAWCKCQEMELDLLEDQQVLLTRP